MPAKATTRGRGTRASIVQTIADRPGVTEEEIIKKVAKSKGTVRNVLGTLRERGFVTTKRGPSKGRGPGPLEYKLNLRGRRTPDSIVEELEAASGAPGGRRTARNVYVFVKKGTNVAALTKDGRILRVVSNAVDDHMSEAKKQLGKDVAAVSLSDFLRTFYPEGKLDL